MKKNEIKFCESPKNLHTKFRDLNQINTKNLQYSNFDKVLNTLKRKTSHNAMDGIELLIMGYTKIIKTFSAKRQAIAKTKQL